MTISRMPVSLLVCFLFVGLTQTAPCDEGKDELEGSWNLKQIVLEGTAFPERVKGAKFIFTKNRLANQGESLMQHEDPLVQHYAKQFLAGARKKGRE